MQPIWLLIEKNAPYIMLVLSLLALILGLSQVILFRRFREVSRRYRLLMRGPSGADLEEILQRYAVDVKNLEALGQEIKQQQGILQEKLAQCVHNPGLIRFNAFDNMGSDLSFSVALLDRRGDGVVLTGLYGRDETRIYAKPIRKGTSNYSLTEEEAQAVQKTLEKA
ncbi:DUF4446 family protein [Desulforamulus hydrothermalis]|uniref:DUF4446 domain-containing protein n=1 Tax=Desulforamulus hydrothermalis Lam5 = DSM 18033 TaxID=1121428 RepID=K8DZ76_9FIRM|nr:DUF4446 family protein [Desulforamulus hydrothermalis]CCO08332.1 conserved hypothetical protein [Desulforamulus hydrothermalis Lam5 = DSM 18033]SHH45031.1 Protein of unknown function [Desulforamulus hydrothermalis Lam5 = DSM 18033]